MDIDAAVRLLGGAARHGELMPLVGRRAIAHGLETGRIHAYAPGRYALPEADAAVIAKLLGGVLSHSSAAVYLGLDVLSPDNRLHITLPASAARRRAPEGVVFHRSDLVGEVVDAVTSPMRTVLDCARTLRLREALAIGDSALRSGLVSPDEIEHAGRRLLGRDARHTRLALLAMDGRAESVLESALRATVVAAGIPGFVLQHEIRADGRFVARVDLAHPGLRIAVEADGYEHHGGRAQFEKDIARRNEIEVLGWHVLHFAFAHIMNEEDRTATQILAATELRRAQPGHRTQRH